MLSIYSFALLCLGLSLINVVFAYQSKHIDPHFWSTFKFQLMLLPLFLAANLSIGYGVKFGVKSGQNLGVVLVTGKCIEILLSVGVGYLFMKEIPTWKTWTGLAVIAAGLLLVKQK